MKMTGFRRESRNRAKRGASGNGGQGDWGAPEVIEGESPRCQWTAPQAGSLVPPMPAGGVSCAAHGHRPRNPRPSRGRFPGPSGHRALIAPGDRAAGQVAGSGVGVVHRVPHAVHHPRGSGKTGRGLPPPIAVGAPDHPRRPPLPLTPIPPGPP